MPLRFIAHADPRILIDWLRGDIDRQRAGQPLVPLCVLAPNRRLARFLRRRLVAGGRSLLGTRVLDLWALASDLWEGAEALPRLAPPSALRHLVEKCALRAGGGLGRLARSRPGVVQSLLTTFTELREAGVRREEALRLLEEEGESSAAEAPESPAAESVRAYARYLGELEDLGGRGWVDRAGFVQRAVPLASRWASGQRAIYLYGAYELIGVHIPLLRALAASVPVTFLLPLGREGRGWDYGIEFARRFLLGDGEEIEFLAGAGQAGALTRAAERLFASGGAAADGEEGPPPLGGETLTLLHAQGVEAELDAVARRILDLRGRNVPLKEIGVVARSLRTYEPLLERVFGGHGIPYSTSAEQPLSRFPVVVALRALLRALALDFERDDVLAFLASPLARAPQGGRPRPDLLERWSAEAALRKGLSAWLEDLPAGVRGKLEEEGAREGSREAEERCLQRDQELQSQLQILASLGEEARAWHRCSGWQAQAGFIAALGGRWISGFDLSFRDPALQSLAGILQEMRATGMILGTGGGPADPAALLEAFEGAVASASVPIRENEDGGVSVLDGMQARGTFCRALFVIGFNAGLFPLHLPEDPFLPEPWRRRLRSAEGGGRPVPLRENLPEEHLLLALWIASAGERLVVSYRRSDEDGRAEVPSFALRELARLRLGRPDPQALRELAARIPVHPADRIRHFREDPGLVAPAESDLLVALMSGEPSVLRERLSRRGGLDSGLASALRWMEERRGRWCGSEGRAGALPAPAIPRPWSPSRLESLARCPLRYFFEHVLEIPEPPEPPEDGIFDPLDWGSRTHALLKEVFANLRSAGSLQGGAGRSGAEEALCRAQVEAAWERHFGELGRRVSRRLPVLWQERAARWRAAVAAFLLREAGLFREQGLELIGVEQDAACALGEEGGAAQRVLLGGRLDRLERTPAGGIRVTDYKTGRTLKDLDDGAQALRGMKLQGHLYAWMAEAGQRQAGREGAEVEIEFAGVGPHYERKPDEARAPISAETLRRLRPGVEETVRVLVRMAGAGIFPFRHEARQCERCGFEPACHHRDRPARLALEAHATHADYFDTLKKGVKRPTLALVRSAGADGE